MPLKRLSLSSLILASLALIACGDERALVPSIPAWAQVASGRVEEARKHGVPVALENELGMLRGVNYRVA